MVLLDTSTINRIMLIASSSSLKWVIEICAEKPSYE